MQKIAPCLWYDSQAQKAVDHYTSIFADSKIVNVSHYDETSAAASGRPAGSVMVIDFELEGQPFMALNGGPHFTFSPAISLCVNCTTQDEIDTFWDRLSEGGSPGQCGWLSDRFGVSWQIVPQTLGEMMTSRNSAQRSAVMQALLKMTRLDLAALRRAYDRA